MLIAYYNPQNAFHIANEYLISGISSSLTEMLKKKKKGEIFSCLSIKKVILISLLQYLISAYQS